MKFKDFTEYAEYLVCKQLKELIPASRDSEFHDVYVQTITPKDSTGKPIPTEHDLTTEAGRLKAFTAVVPASAEAGTPGGMRIQGYVNTPVEEHQNVVTNLKKTASRQGNLVIFNIFDSGVTKDAYNNVHGAIKNNSLREVGNGLYEITTTGVFGRCLTPTWPEFYVYVNGTISEGKNRTPDGKWSETIKRTARARPMFLLHSEVQGYEARINREARRMHFVQSSTKPMEIDDTEAEKANASREEGPTGPVLTPKVEETIPATGTV